MKSGDIESVTMHLRKNMIAKIIQMLFCYCQQKLIQHGAYCSIFNECITKFGNSIPGWGSSFQVQLTWLEEKKIKLIHCGKWCKCIVKLKKKKNIEDRGRNIPSYLWDITSFNQNSFTFLKILMRKKKREQSHLSIRTLSKEEFFFP